MTNNVKELQDMVIKLRETLRSKNHIIQIQQKRINNLRYAMKKIGVIFSVEHKKCKETDKRILDKEALNIEQGGLF